MRQDSDRSAGPQLEGVDPRRRACLAVALAASSSPLTALSAATQGRWPAPGEWLELAGASPGPTAPARDGHPAWGVIGPRAVTDAWGGAAFDPTRGVLVITGGGHADYGGNEVYEFDLASRHWRRATDPSPMREVGPGRFEVLGEPAPVSSHSYDGLQWVPTLDGIFKFGGSCYRDGAAYDRHGYLYSTQSHRWRRLAEAPDHCLQVTSAFDPARNRVLIGTGTGLMAYDAASDRWLVLSSGIPDRAVCGAVVVPAQDRLVTMEAKSGAIGFHDLATPARRWPAVPGVTPPWPRHAGMAYHDRSNRIVVWGGDARVWTIDPRTWSVSQVRASGGAAPTDRGDRGRLHAGVYSRWQYVAEHDVFIACPHFDGNVWMYRLPIDA